MLKKTLHERRKNVKRKINIKKKITRKKCNELHEELIKMMVFITMQTVLVLTFMHVSTVLYAHIRKQ